MAFSAPTEGTAAFDRLVESGLEPDAAAKTYEWHCRACDTTTYTSAVGGMLNDGRCEPHCAGKDLEIHTILAGVREYWCVALDLEGTKAAA